MKEYPKLNIPREPHWDTAKPSLVDRLRGIYAIGPNADQKTETDPPEFGWRVFENLEPIRYEAAAYIEELESKILDLEEENKEIQNHILL